MDDKKMGGGPLVMTLLREHLTRSNKESKFTSTKFNPFYRSRRAPFINGGMGLFAKTQC